MNIFWNQADTPIKWKMRVFDAIIRSKLLYGLETIHLTPAEQAKLDSFQMKGLRRIMHIQPTHLDRSWTNLKVMDKANEEAGKPIVLFTTMWRRQNLTYSDIYFGLRWTTQCTKWCSYGEQKSLGSYRIRGDQEGQETNGYHSP